VLAEIPEWSDCKRYPSLVLFYLFRDGNNTELRPLLIQLNQTILPNYTIYFPPSAEIMSKPDWEEQPDWIAWMFARMHIASSDSQIHEMVTHLGLTHLLMEPLIIGTFRQFEQSHVVFEILRPHMRQTIAINELGRLTLLAPGGFFDIITALGTPGTMSLIQQYWTTSFKFEERSFPKELLSRGFEKIPLDQQGGDTDPLPGYLYRDYGFMIWDALESYVRKIVFREIPSDSSVENDACIQHWAAEISDPRYGNVPGFPRTIRSREHLVQILTNIIFTATAKHSAVNFGQFDFYGFVPNRPLALTKPMPLDVNKIDWKYVMSALPNRSRTREQMEITAVLSITPEMALKMDLGKDKHAVGIPMKDALESEEFWKPVYVEDWQDLMEKLKVTETMMMERNTKHGYYYPYLYFSRIASSVSI